MIHTFYQLLGLFILVAAAGYTFGAFKAMGYNDFIKRRKNGEIHS